ncbi:HCM1 [Candida theae]|uniref:HCM1 n=1 Tax=Candida theae TaxID=1198502 RepID=A0AAD5BDN2_9ASCO|nr:HCM1 [Candida theae]KAI5955482.1 HCM1 [Candida theae]
MSSISATDKSSGDRLPLSDSTNTNTNNITTIAPAATTTTTTPSKLTRYRSTSSSTHTPPHTATTTSFSSSIKTASHGGFDAFGFNTPLRTSSTTTHLDPKSILSSINYEPKTYNMQSTYLSPASSSPQHQAQPQQHSPQTFAEEPEKEKGSPPNKKKNSNSSPATKEEQEEASTSTSSTDTASTTTSNTSVPNKPFNLYSEEKPPYSYATLIGIAILSQPQKRLTLANIYQWISDTFNFYKKEEVGWQNSIRHNLSLNKAFVKAEKSRDGKGHYWRIKPGFEEQFLRSRSVKKSSYHEVMDQLNYATKMNAAMAAAAAADEDAKATTTTTTITETANPSVSNTTKETTTAPTQTKRSTNGSTSIKRKRKQPIMLMSSPTIPQKKLVEDDRDFSVSEDNDDEYGEEDITILDPPVKKFKSQRNSDDDSEEEDLLSQALTKSKSGNSYLSELPAWAANTLYSESPTKLPPISHLTNSVLSTPKSTPNSNSNRSNGNINVPHFHITESPENPIFAGKNLTFTSSFSCNSNFELSPMRTSETGPLLEPVTPSNNNAKGSGCHPQIAQLAQSQPSSVSSSAHLQHTNSIFGSTSKQMFIFTRTPKSVSTPLRKTPTTNSIISYLEEYFSPLNDNNNQSQHSQPLLHQLPFANNLHIPASHPLHYIQTPTSTNATTSSSSNAGSLLMQSTMLSGSVSSSTSSTSASSSHSKLNNVVASSSSASTSTSTSTKDCEKDDGGFTAFQSSPFLKRGFSESSKSRRLIHELEKLQRDS